MTPENIRKLAEVYVEERARYDAAGVEYLPSIMRLRSCLLACIGHHLVRQLELGKPVGEVV